VAVVVQEGVQRVFSTFVEALRRESLKVSDGHATQKSVSTYPYVDYVNDFIVLEKRF
jgi:hypothetical protein